MSPDKLAYMANQISRAFAYQPHDQAVTSTEQHLRQFWDPRMRKAIKEQLTQGHARLDSIAREAVERLPD